MNILSMNKIESNDGCFPNVVQQQLDKIIKSNKRITLMEHYDNSVNIYCGDRENSIYLVIIEALQDKDLYDLNIYNIRSKQELRDKIFHHRDIFFLNGEEIDFVKLIRDLYDSGIRFD